MKTNRFYHFALLFLIFQLASVYVSGQAKPPFALMTVKSRVQGTFIGSGTGGKIGCTNVTLNDGGDIKNRTVVIEKEQDASSTKLLQALNNNESLPQIIIEIPNVHKTYLLTNAVISKMTDKGTTETITFKFEKIEIQSTN